MPLLLQLGKIILELIRHDRQQWIELAFATMLGDDHHERGEDKLG
jgi:hypothetical protein